MNPTLALIYVQNWMAQYVTRRTVTTFLAVFFGSMFLHSGVAVAAEDQGPIDLPGMGSLFPIPEPAEGTGQTLREAYPDTAWYLTSEMENVGGSDFGDLMMLQMANLLMWLIRIITYCIIGMSYWVFGSSSLPGANTGTAEMMSSLSQIVLTQMLPVTLLLALFAAYAQVRRLDWSTAIWGIMSAVFAVAMLTGPLQVINGVDQVRQAGMGVVASVSTGAGEQSMTDPLPSPNPPVYNADDPKGTMLRSVEDTVWRQLVATPWCMAQFGGVEACERYGPTMLNMASDADRQDYIQKEIYESLSADGNADEGKNSATGQWIKGEDSAGRIGMLTFNLVFVLIFGILLLGTGLTALVGLGMSYMLLGIGPFFAALWVIEGRPRQWGMGWFNLLVAAVASTVLSSLLFMVALNIVGAVIRTASGGWATASVSALIILFSAFAVKNQVLGLFGAQSVSLMKMAAYGYAGQRIIGGGARTLGSLARGGFKAGGMAARGAGALGRGAGRGAGMAAEASGQAGMAVGREVAAVFRDPGSPMPAKPSTRRAGDPAPVPRVPAGGNKPSPARSTASTAARFTAKPVLGDGPQPTRPAAAPPRSTGPGRPSAPARTTTTTGPGAPARTAASAPRYGETPAQAARRNQITSVDELPGQTNVVSQRLAVQRTQPKRTPGASAALEARRTPATGARTVPTAVRTAGAAPAPSRRTNQSTVAQRTQRTPVAPATATPQQGNPARQVDAVREAPAARQVPAVSKPVQKAPKAPKVPKSSGPVSSGSTAQPVTRQESVRDDNKVRELRPDRRDNP